MLLSGPLFPSVIVAVANDTLRNRGRSPSRGQTFVLQRTPYCLCWSGKSSDFPQRRLVLGFGSECDEIALVRVETQPLLDLFPLPKSSTDSKRICQWRDVFKPSTPYPPGVRGLGFTSTRHMGKSSFHHALSPVRLTQTLTFSWKVRIYLESYYFKHLHLQRFPPFGGLLTKGRHVPRAVASGPNAITPSRSF